MSGNLIIEIAGPDNHLKADKLADKLKSTLAGEATVIRPTKTGELLLRGIDESITADEVITSISNLGGCTLDQIKLGSLKIMRNGLGTVWARCPLEAAIKLAELGPIRLGWTCISVELLQARKLQCFKCMEFGHVKTKCTNEIDRSTLCYKCGQNGHIARDCIEPPSCVLCREKGYDSKHRIGSSTCLATTKQVGRGGGTRSTTVRNG